MYIKEEFIYNSRTLYKESELWEGFFIDVYNENINKKNYYWKHLQPAQIW